MVKIITKKEQKQLEELNYLLSLYDIDLETIKVIVSERTKIQDEMEKMRKLDNKLKKKFDEFEKKYSVMYNKLNPVEAKEKKKKEIDEFNTFLNEKVEVRV